MTATRKPTLADIAAKTGYGVNTVSLALRGSTVYGRPRATFS